MSCPPLLGFSSTQWDWYGIQAGLGGACSWLGLGGSQGRWGLTESTSLSLLPCPAELQAHPEKPLEPLLSVGRNFSSGGSGSALSLPER